jgi:hypothetical protein
MQVISSAIRRFLASSCYILSSKNVVFSTSLVARHQYISLSEYEELSIQVRRQAKPSTLLYTNVAVSCILKYLSESSTMYFSYTLFF